MSAAGSASDEPPRKHGRAGLILPRFFVPTALGTLLVIAAASWTSWTLVGDYCIDSTRLARGSPKGAVCELEVANWHDSSVVTASFADPVHEDVVLVLPVVVVLVGIAVAARRERHRPLWIALLIAVLALLTPLVGIIVLPS
jgi:hypothetical protein